MACRFNTPWTQKSRNQRQNNTSYSDYFLSQTADGSTHMCNNETDLLPCSITRHAITTCNIVGWQYGSFKHTLTDQCSVGDGTKTMGLSGARLSSVMRFHRPTSNLFSIYCIVWNIHTVSLNLLCVNDITVPLHSRNSYSRLFQNCFADTGHNRPTVKCM